jgi:arsenate reductase (thioredoxin)
MPNRVRFASDRCAPDDLQVLVEKRRVLFLCTGNRARSQMAEGFLRHLAANRFEVFSAGTQPKSLAAETITVMREVGIDISGQRSKSIEEFLDQNFDYLITLCNVARASCPTLRGVVHQEHWDIADPADLERQGMDRMQSFRIARDRLSSRIDEFVRRP